MHYDSSRQVPAPARLSVGLLIFVLGGCADAIGPDIEEGAAVIEPVPPTVLSGTPGFPLADSIAVKVMDSSGTPLPGATVHFTAVEGGGTVLPVSATTDEAGMARTRWVMGPTEAENALEATVAGASESAAFTASARFGRETQVVALAGSRFGGVAGCPVAEPLAVRVLDAGGAVVAGAPVLFAAPGSPADGVVVRTNAEGVASHAWRPGGGDEEVVAKIGSPGGASVAFEVSAVPVAPGGYGAVGPVVYGPECTSHRFVGMARPGLQWWPDDARLSDPALSRQEFETMRSWGANIVRIPVYQRYWLRDMTLGGVVYPAAAYQELLQRTVERANAAGLAVVIDLHASDRGDPSFPDDVTDIQQMADVAHSVPFWKSVAETFKDNGRVLFQLYNEPNQIDWELWRNGGMIPEGDTYPPQSSGVAFEAAGMQELYEAVRETGAHNMVIVNGLHWGYDLSRLREFALDGYNIMYATHPYDYPDKQPDSWDAAWGFVADSYPLIIAEFGDYTCNADGYYTSLLNYADAHDLSWIAWAWWAPPADEQELICKFPALLMDWSGTPSPTGEVVRARMSGYR